MTKGSTSQRLNVLTFIIVSIFIALLSRLVWLQALHGEEFKQKAENNRIRLLPITAPRGTFYDRNGVPLVNNRPGFSISLVPIKGPIPREVIVRLAEILGMNPEDIQKKMSQQGNPLLPTRIKSDVGPEIITKIEERREDLPGVVIEVQAVRSYIYNELGAHTFGYVGEISDSQLANGKANGYKSGDMLGKTGLEQVWDKELRGVDGGAQVEVNVSGKPVQMLGKKQPIAGNDLILTINAKIQRAAEKAMDERLKYLQDKLGNPEAKAAAAVVMNPQTGEILAMVSRPTFDPNKFNGGISAKDWKEINDNPNNPMQNRTIGASYPPGSAFKIVTGTAALETGKITPEEKIFDAGRHRLAPAKGNSHNAALGWIDFRVALAKSDNVYFYELGNRLGIDTLEQWARKFGLGAVTGINLPDEDDGLVANQRYKKKVYDEDWVISETFDAAIGQGFNLATPIQMAVVTSIAANGGHRYRPYLVSKMVSPDGQVLQTFEPEELGTVPMSPSTLTAIRTGLRDVVTPSGTAGYIFEGFPVPIAGKTSTAENPHGDDHGWFVAYGPYDNPTIAIAVIVEQGGFGSDSAAPIARKIMEAAFDLPPSRDAADIYAEEWQTKQNSKVTAQ
ncbi:penicillin-binding protein 2 [Pelosinus sp. IPA-1]|uniref:penicillin-binding protein 2 n=1 Tax=Pelosinus sp. IPA-1 TaxID=3029569 RepID=UPI0024361F7A|nr:penicillin-binding protein 2 [Pelosinus sp. IPA-1]GMA98736.1 penicillin-binding protein 2 [Pelosinus sp. IPA-1]